MTIRQAMAMAMATAAVDKEAADRRGRSRAQGPMPSWSS